MLGLEKEEKETQKTRDTMVVQRRDHIRPHHPCRAGVCCNPARSRSCPTNSSPSSSRCQRRSRIQRQGHRGRASCRKKRSTHQTSMIETTTGLPQWRWTRGCCATADIRACSLSVDTSLYPVTLPWAISTAPRSLASALCCGVTVTRLRAHGILLEESEAVVHETTVTSGIDRVTIHELLLAQRRRVAGGDKMGTFEGTRGRKCPTRATLHLVLHWRHRSLRGPYS